VTRGELIAELAASLGARHEARFIVEEVLGRSPSAPTTEVNRADVEVIRALAARRRASEPLQYVLGHWAFRSLDLLVDPRVLIPRPETEQVVEVAVAEVRAGGPTGPTIVDAGTGSGAIALALAVELERGDHRGQVVATDTSADALAVAGANLERVRRQHGDALLPVTLRRGSWLSPLPPALRGTVDLVVSNPPYVATGEWPDLPDDVRREPRGALVAGDASDGTPGLSDVEEVLAQAWRWLSPRGVVVIELAPHQAEAAVSLARRLGYVDVRVEPDLAQRPRALVGRTP
jgi:release factor glutamine methyltransferase